MPPDKKSVHGCGLGELELSLVIACPGGTTVPTPTLTITIMKHESMTRNRLLLCLIGLTFSVDNLRLEPDGRCPQ